jgi:hypothetical protein
MNTDLYLLDDMENLQDDEFCDEGKPFKSINAQNYHSKASSKLYSSIN